MSKIILLDVDGTLVDYDNNLPDSAVRVIRAALNSIWKATTARGLRGGRARRHPRVFRPQGKENVNRLTVREAFPDMIFDGELYRHDVNKISYVLGSYRDFLDTRGRFPDLESGTWGGRGATALFGDLGVKGITKAHAIDRLLAHLGANRQDTVAFGDAAVDIPMLEYCAVGVAMGNGSEDIKAMAGIVAGDVEEDGLARAFERLGLM